MSEIGSEYVREAESHIESAFKRIDDGRYERASILIQAAQTYAMLAIAERLDTIYQAFHNMSAQDESALRIENVG